MNEEYIFQAITKDGIITEVIPANSYASAEDTFYSRNGGDILAMGRTMTAAQMEARCLI